METNLNHRNLFIALLIVVTTVSFAALPNGTLRLQSRDLGISNGSEIRIDGKVIGTAPCEFTLRTSARHKLELKAQNMAVETCFLTVKVLKKSELVDNIPAWFLNPTTLQPKFLHYESLTPATATSATISDAVVKAQSEVRRKLTSTIDRYFTVREQDGKSKLDSSKSKYYPKLTRGQMDSLSDVNGGKIVAQSLANNGEPVFLEYEIQKVGNEYRVYVLAGEKRK
jgi:hypothetical protein